MAEELSASISTSSQVLELAICQPERPNQAVFVPDLDIDLQEFRIKISESALILPEEWVFMTRAGSLISADQEGSVLLNSIARERDGTSVMDVMVAPALSYRGHQHRGAATPGPSPLASFATIAGALRDVYVTSIQPNMHELIKPLIITAGAAAVLSLILTLILSLSLGALGGISRSLFVPFLRNHLCGEDIEVASQIPRLYQRVHELETKIGHMRQVEVGTLICKEDNHMYEETETTTMHIPFKKTNFTDTPRLIFSLRGVSVDDFNSVRLESLQVNRTGFTVRCSYFGKWMHYSMEFSWLAVGR